MITLEELISDAIETEGFDEIIEQAANSEISAILRRSSVRSLMIDAIREAMSNHADDIETKILDQIQEAADEQVASYVD